MAPPPPSAPGPWRYSMIGTPASAVDAAAAARPGGARSSPPPASYAPPPRDRPRTGHMQYLEYEPRAGGPGLQPVTWLHGVGYSRGYDLYRADIRTVDDMARVPDVAAAASLSGLPASFIERSRLKARAAVENRVIQRSRMALPPDEEMAIFDIETDTRAHTVWLIGVLHRGRVEQFMIGPGDRDDRRTMPGGYNEWGARRVLSEFVDHLGSLASDGCTALVSYSGTGFDRRVTGDALARHGLDPGAFGAVRHIDACSLVRRSFAVPCQTYALKTLGAALGYRFSHSGMDGLDAALAFERHVAYGSPIDRSVLEYNRDDVLSVKHILDSLAAGGFDVERRGAAAAGRRAGGGSRAARGTGRRPRPGKAGRASAAGGGK